uniref:Uncharacterized protein n=1 Tax=Lepeophtheirus salmonis TaxID=72036 RepID=A0A0K2VLG9_LEPSM
MSFSMIIMNYCSAITKTSSHIHYDYTRTTKTSSHIHYDYTRTT